MCSVNALVRVHEQVSSFHRACNAQAACTAEAAWRAANPHLLGHHFTPLRRREISAARAEAARKVRMHDVPEMVGD